MQLYLEGWSDPPKGEQKMIERLLKISLAVLMFLLVLLVGLQVFSRYILNDPTSWSEEAANLTLVFMVFIGGTLAIYRKSTLRITFLVDKLSPRAAAFIDLTMKIMVLIFLAFTIVYGIIAVIDLRNHITAGLEWSKSIIFSAVPLGGLLMLIATIRDIPKSYKNWRRYDK